MAGRNPQTQAKRAREIALKEKRERKRARKAERAEAAAAEKAAPDVIDDGIRADEQNAGDDG